MIILYVTLKSFKKNMIRIKILSKDFPIKEHIIARHFFLPQSGPKNCFSHKNTTIRSLWSNYNFVINSSIAIHICYLTSFCMKETLITNNFTAIMTIVKIFFFGLFLTYIPPFQNTCRFSHMIKTDAKFILHKIVRKMEWKTHAKQLNNRCMSIFFTNFNWSLIFFSFGGGRGALFYFFKLPLSAENWWEITQIQQTCIQQISTSFLGVRCKLHIRPTLNNP